MIAIKARKFEKKYRRPVQFDSREAARFNKKLAKCFKCKKTGHFARECRSQVSQESTNYKNYKKKEAAKDTSESSAFVVIDGSQGTNSTVLADDVPASAFIFAEPTIPADRVIAAKTSVLAVDGIPADSEFAMMSLPSKEGKPIYNRFTKVNNYKGVPPPMNGNYMRTSTSPDTDESPKHYGKQASESTKIKSTSKKSKFLFDFSDRSSVPTASDSCVENARPNNVVHDSDEFTSRTSTSGSEEQVDNVCIPQEDLSSSTSLGFDVQSSDSMYCNFHNHNGKGILGKGPSVNHVNTSYKRSFPISADKSFGSRAYTPYYPMSKHFPTSHNSFYFMHLDDGTFGGTAVKPSADIAKDTGIAYSGCSRSMSGNRDKLDAFMDFDGGPVRFGGSNGMITGKGTIKTKNLDFENVLYVLELEPFNLLAWKNLLHKLLLHVYLLKLPRMSPIFGIGDLDMNTNVSAGNQGSSFNNAGCQDLDSDSGDEQDVIIVQNSPTLVTSTIHDVLNHEEAAQSVLSPSLDLNDDDMEELSSLWTQEQDGKDAAQRLGLAFPTHLVTHEASSIPAEKSSSVSPASSPTASAGNTPPVYSRPSAGRSSKSTGKKLASSFKTSIPVDRSISARKSIPADRSVSADKSISADRSISASRDTNSADRHPSKLSSNAVNEAHPHSLIIGDLHTPVQTRKKAKAQVLTHNAFVSYIQDQRRNNHTDFHLCLFSCFLSQMEPTSVAQALLDPDWVEAMKEELQQFQNQRVWVLVKLPESKHAIRKKWILKNKRDARGIVCRNKARLVAQGHRQEEGIDYTEVFAPVARVEAIRLFLAFASYMGFMVYQMDVKSAFLNEEIREEVYVTQPKGFEDPKRGTIDQTLFLKKDSKDIILVDQRSDGIFIHQTKYVNDILYKFDMDTNKSTPTPFEPPKIKDKNLPDGSVNVHLYRSMIGSLMYLTASRPDITFAGHPKLGLWYLRDSPFNLEAFSNSDYAGAAGDRKSTTGGCQFMGRRLISLQCKKQTIVATSSCEAKYVVAASCCGQYGFVPADTMTRVTWNSFLLIELVATIDGHEHTISEVTIRTALHLDDLDAADVLPNQEIFDGLQAIGYRPDGPWSFLFKKVWKPIGLCLSMLIHSVHHYNWFWKVPPHLNRGQTCVPTLNLGGQMGSHFPRQDLLVGLV
nr:hypothetical protein [Tanacetum cinerariifolium]